MGGGGGGTKLVNKVYNHIMGQIEIRNGGQIALYCNLNGLFGTIPGQSIWTENVLHIRLVQSLLLLSLLDPKSKIWHTITIAPWLFGLKIGFFFPLLKAQRQGCLSCIIKFRADQTLKLKGKKITCTSALFCLSTCMNDKMYKKMLPFCPGQLSEENKPLFIFLKIITFFYYLEDFKPQKIDLWRQFVTVSAGRSKSSGGRYFRRANMLIQTCSVYCIKKKIKTCSVYFNRTPWYL